MADQSRHDPLFGRILWALVLGVAAGLVFGEATAPLGLVSNGFIRLLQVNVLPYVLGSLIASLGSRRSSEMAVIVRHGLVFLALAWGLALALVLLMPLAMPQFSGETVFGASEPAPQIDWLELYIPSNLFHSLSNNLIPAVVLFGVLAGVALGQMQSEHKATLLAVLDAFNEAMVRISRIILRLTPIGIFAIAAVTAGEIRFEELLRLQVWLHLYAGSALLLTFWAFPGLVARLTPIPYVEFLKAMRSPIVTAAVAGDALVVLPLVTEASKELLARYGASGQDSGRAVNVCVPLVYNLPNAGKMLALAFLPFAAWFSGNSLNVIQQLELVSAGPLSLFGNINAAVPFLLDILHLPADLFELFAMSSVINSRFGSMVSVAHIAAVSLLIAAAMVGAVRVSLAHLARFALVTAAIVAVFLGSTRVVFTWLLPPVPSGLEALNSFDLRPPFVPASVVAAEPSPAAPQAGQRLREIRARGVLRVGYFGDAMPWAFVNARGQLVGYDVEAAHRLARQLDLRLEFVQVPRLDPAINLDAGRIDILMTGFAATTARAERMELSHPYSSEHLGFLVHDHERRRFDSLETLGGGEGLRVAIPPVEGSQDVVTGLMPRATIRRYESVDAAIRDPEMDAVLMPIERAHYWSRVNSAYAAVRPRELRNAVVTVYAMPYGELDLRNLIDLWIETRKASGEADEAEQYWIQGRAFRPREPRWSLLHEVLGRQ